MAASAASRPPAGSEEDWRHGSQEHWRRGSLKESNDTAKVMIGLLGLQLVLLAWWWAGRGSVGEQSSHLERQLLHLLGFLTACNTVLLITQAERRFERPPAPGESVGWGERASSWASGWGSRLCLLAALAAWVWFLFDTNPDRDAELWAWIAVWFLNAVALLSVAATVAGRMRSAQVEDTATRTAPGTGSPMSGPGLTVALSGGGIRAATFALGAWNAIGEHKEEVEHETGPIGPRLVAVSGGSYLAASIMLLRRHVVRGNAADRLEALDSPSWDRIYAVTSPEMTRLRRHSRDLVEPRARLLGGLLILLSGSIVNLLVLVGFAWFAAWVLSWLYTTTGVLHAAATRREGEEVTEQELLFDLPDLNGLTVADEAPWFGPDVWVVTWLLPSLALLTAVLIIIVRIFVGNRVDHDQPVPRPVGMLAKALGPVAGVALAYVVVVVGVPYALFALNQLAVHNAPTQSAASAIKAMGFADESFCRAGLRESVERAYESANALAALSVGTTQTSTAGSCGREVAVSVKHATAGETGYGSDEIDDVVEGVVRTVQRSPGPDLASGATALFTLVTTLALAVRRANQTEAAALQGWRGKVRRVFTTWLPFAALFAVLGWLLLSWTFESVLRGAAPPSPWIPLLLAGGALSTAVLVDANATALHSYYRQRLSSAWAVGRTPDGGVAELPAKKAYTFSGLGDLPLHVVTTANVRAYAQTATRRGGVPLVFDPGAVTLVHGEQPCVVPMELYEDCAGRGRVSVMATVATSGAAVSPMAGRYSYNIAPFRLLLTLFNVRVGAWVANPRWGRRPPLEKRARPWLISRPGAAQVFAEAMGKSSVEHRWLYLSDGGHLDNTGLVEAVRVHADGGRIVVVDASNDVVDSWSAVGDALGVIRADLGIDLQCKHGAVPASKPDGAVVPDTTTGWWRRVIALVRPPVQDVEPQPYMRIYEAELPDDKKIEVMVVKAVRPDLSDEKLPEAVRSFTLRTPEFPRSSTTRQDFGDVEFEAYRALGEYYMRLAWKQWTKHRAPGSHPSRAD